ncbi:hypothetical protein M0657_004708 [Pyricularia oryzae]|uniref:DH domain-containing protein n=2 Tax=Pyricularia oryzae TaxID=318829 RepID=A0AA97P7B0_PYRO3|nr:hypothetical protein OOU_Y34scaffold00162g24 [Pyricularia oryzae Y34]KAI7921913.1 hypothetical protein M9X92_005082 [Pyricularia oryzae]KAI7924363.1 hypothetical protein M0657_004708 [Pyricularia oryzae]
MDGGNEEDRLGTAPLPPSSRPFHHQQQHDPRQQHHHHNHNHSHSHYQQHYNYELDDDAFTSSTAVSTIQHYDRNSNRPEVATYAAANFQAVAANAAAVAYPNSDFSNAAPPESPSEPDDFYRDHRGRPADSMASAALPQHHALPHSHNIAHSRQTSATSRSDPYGASIVSKHGPNGLSAGHSGPRSTYRSASMPIDDKPPKPAAGAYGPSKQPSVKDLKKRFDQAVAEPSQGKAIRQPGARLVSKDGSSGTARGRLGGPPGTYLTLRTSVDRDAGSFPTRSNSRQRYVEEDQLSSNAKSFASRMRPKAASTATSTLAQAAKAVSPPPVRSPSVPAASPRSARPTGLLFGEILPQDDGSRTVGYGIDDMANRSRRTSHQQAHDITSPDRASQDDGEPASPVEWYRRSSKGSRIPTSIHVRTQSDTSANKPAISGNRRPASRQNRNSTSSQASQPASPSSRLPISVKKLGESPSHSSPSTRANSPSQPLPASGRSSRQHVIRAKTPTTRSATPTSKRSNHSTPTTSRRAAPNKIATPSNQGNTRLAAYISAPPPKLSPPLRSSRPRQPVSSASTASSRLKAVERSSGNKRSGHDDEPNSRRRKIDVGPIDFAQRRETIKLAYSKSIRESQAREARQAAAARRKEQMAAAAKAKVEAEKALQTHADASSAKHPPEQESPVIRADQAASGEQGPAADSGLGSSGPSLRLVTSETKTDADTTTADVPSKFPDLEIPGSFPSFGTPDLAQDEVPMSAISNTSVVTEFDDEPQTEPPVSIGQTSGLGIHVPSAQPGVVYAKAIYQSPFEDDRAEGAVQPTTDATQGLPYGYEPANNSAPPTTEPERGSASEAELLAGSQHMEDIPILIQGQDDKSLVEPVVKDDATAQQDSPAEQQTPPTSSHQMPEYEPGPFVPQSQPTTVTILSRGSSDFLPPVQTSLRTDIVRDLDGSSQSPHMDSLEDFYIGGPHLRDNISALRDSTFMSSEASDEHMASSAEAQRTPDTSRSLTVPGLMSPANRTSQHSAWTDFSLESSDAGRDFTSKAGMNFISRDSTVRGRPPMLDSRPDSYASDHRSEDHGYNSDVPRADGRSTGAFQLERHELPELDTGDGFTMDYVSPSAKRSSVPGQPDHEPPPIPTPDNRSVQEGRRTPSSSYYDQTRPNSYLQSVADDEFGGSRRESEEFTQPTFTPHSTGHASLDSTGMGFSRTTTLDADPKTASADDVKDQTSVQTGASGKERSRLVQRQNVVKELIDTEGSFVRDMNVIEEIYKGTAEACPKLDNKTIKLIFRNTDEIIAFHTAFHLELKEAVASVYSPKGRRSPLSRESKDDPISDSMTVRSNGSSPKDGRDTNIEPDDGKDRQTSIGPVFVKGIEQMRVVHESFLRTSDPAAKRLIQIQEDPAVQVWLSECNEAARDLTAAWNLDSLLIKPMQRITKYPNLISQLLQYTPEDHPDREALISARNALETAILDINKTKKNFELVGQIVGRKRKESDVRAGFARAFGKRVDKLQAATIRVEEDTEYKALQEKFGDDYLRLQVVLRDVEFYTRKVSEYVHEFLQYLSAMELVMRLQPSPFPEIESKWARFNVSMRDMEKVALDQHLAQVRKHVIEPFELVIRCYNHPSLAMKKRAKRRLDFERAEQLKKAGKKVDKQLSELVEQYEALNETLKKELPKLSAHTEKIGNICLGNFVCIQVKWFSIWKDKVKAVLDDKHVPEMSEVVSSFNREFKSMEEQIASIGIINPSLKPRMSQSTTDDGMSRIKSRPSELSTRSRGLSINDMAPTIPTPDFVRANNGQNITSPAVTSPTSSSHYYYYYKEQHSGLNGHGQSRYAVPASPSHNSSLSGAPPRPPTSRSYDSGPSQRPSVDSTAPPIMGSLQQRRDSGSTYATNYASSEQRDRRFSGLFSSAMPPEEAEERQLRSRQPSQRPSRASSRERPMINGYNVMFLAASLFEFNIEDTKHEAGYPYLTYQAGEIFDVIAEKGELWLAKNQDDPARVVGWIWSKHFAKLADP